MGKTKQRPRMSEEQVLQTATMGSGKGLKLNLPKGVRQWQPPKAGTFTIDHLIYEVTMNGHPDGAEAGTIWYRFPFKVHRNIGVNDEMVICPTSVGKPCPVCEDRKKLIDKSYDDNEDAIKALRAQEWVAYPIMDPDDSAKTAVFAYNKAKYAEPLGDELKANPKVRMFFDCNENGRTLKVRFSESTYEGRKFLEASRFDFEPRKPMDEEKTLARSVNLDKIFDGMILSYDKLKALYLQEDPTESAKDKDEEPGTVENDPPAQDAPEANDEQQSNDEPTIEVGSRVKWEDEGEEKEGEVLAIKGEDVKIKLDDGSKDMVDIDQLTLVEEEQSQDEQQDENAPAADAEIEVGVTVKFTHKKKGEITGTVTEIDGDTVTVKDEDDREFLADKDQCEIVVDEAASQPDPEPAEKPSAKKTSLPVCPVKGGVFGRNSDEFKECSKCPHWDACDQATAAYIKAKKAAKK